MDKNNGMYYAPKGKPKPVVEKDVFTFSVAFLKHGHIYGMTNGLTEAGATLKYIYDDDQELVDRFIKEFPQAVQVKTFEEILSDKETKLVASAAITSERADIGCEVMGRGKDYFTDKAPFTSMEQIERAKQVIKNTGMKYMVYYGEYLHVESAIYAKQLIDEGAIGEVVQVIGLGPHRLNAKSRPKWFFEKSKYGGILCDIGSHQIYQFLIFADVDQANIVTSQIANYDNPEYPELDDFGDTTLRSDTGKSMYLRVDWFTPDGLSTWGDGRTMILGTKGYIELRKYVDIAKSNTSDNVYLVNDEGEKHFNVHGQIGYPFFGELILDCMNRTEIAMTQHRALLAAELSVKAQMNAVKIK